MDFSFLDFLGTGAFFVVWYSLGVVGAAWIVYDTRTNNRHVTRVLKVAWPTVTLFFSIIGLVLYIWSCRPQYRGRKRGAEAQAIHVSYTSDRWKKVVGSVAHCVGGDALGIVTAMVVTRSAGATFWLEFWIEYVAGFLLGWLIFQYWAMSDMGEPPALALWKGFRAEFCSMITLMLGMGLVMYFVTPDIHVPAPKPDTAAFWSLASLGLLVGAVFTYPVNWCLVAVGWKHGM